MLREGEVVLMDQVDQILLLNTFELSLVVEEIVIGAVYPVYITIQEVLRSCHLKEELRVVGQRLRDGCDFFG